MKRIFLTLIATASLLSLCAKTIEPMPVDFKNNMIIGDGEFSVTFEPAKAVMTATGLKVTFKICEVANYDALEVEKIAVGDKILCYGRVVEVHNIDKNDDYVGINPDEFEQCNNFWFNKSETGNYNISTNDCPAYEIPVGTVTKVIPLAVSFKDYSDDPSTPKVTRCNKIKTVLANEEVVEVMITIKRGKITGIERIYMP